MFVKSRKRNKEIVIERGFVILDVAFARVELEKKLALIKAWEESEKIKAENR